VLTVALARGGFRVDGVDHSPEMLAIAADKLARERLDGATTLTTGDVRALPYPDACFDAVTCQGVLHHLADARPCLAEIARVLVPGGAFYLAEPCDRPTPLAAAVRTAMARLRAHRSGRLLARWTARRTAAAVPAGVELAPTVIADEGPISSLELRRMLADLGLSARARHVTHVAGAERVLGERARLALTRAVSWPWRRERGDLVVVHGRKPAATAAAVSR
jgi:SAM-dependent methyltransferase